MHSSEDSFHTNIIHQNTGSDFQRENFSQELSFKKFLLRIAELSKYLLSSWKIILLFAIIGGGAGVLYSMTKRVLFVANCRFVLDEGGSNYSQYSNIASMIGIDLGGGSNGLFQGDNILELYRSRPMILKTLLTKATFSGRKELLIDKYVEINELTKSWNKKASTRHINFTHNPFTRTQDSLVNTIINDINKNYLNIGRPDRKTGVIAVEVKATNEQFAKVFNDQIVKNVNDFYVLTKTNKSQQSLAILQKQADTIRRAFNISVSSIAANTDANVNINPSRQVLKVPSQLKQANAETAKEILAQLVKNIEATKFSLSRETPLIQLVDWPVYPLDKLELTWQRAFVEVAALFTFLCILGLLGRKIIKDVLAS